MLSEAQPTPNVPYFGDAFRLMETSMLKAFVVATCLAAGAGAAAFAEPVSSVPLVQNMVSSDKIVLNRLAANRLAANKLAANRLASNRLASNRLASNRLASNRLAANRLAANSLATNGLPLEAMSLSPIDAGDVTPLVSIVAVTFVDGTRLEMPATD